MEFTVLKDLKPTLQFIKANEQSYPVIWDAAAAYNLDRLVLKDKLESVHAMWVRIWTDIGGPSDITHYLWACLEGGRLHVGERKEPFTVPEVCKILDALGGWMKGYQTIAKILIPTVLSGSAEPDEAASDSKKEDPPKNEPARGGTGTGKRSSKTPQKSESAQNGSGVLPSVNSKSNSGQQTNAVNAT